MLNTMNQSIQTIVKWFQTTPYSFIYLIILVGMLRLNERFWFILPNEELIVVFCFFSFVFFCSQNLTHSIYESLESRSTSIAKELQQVISLQKTKSIEIEIEQKKQLLLSQVISKIGNFSTKRMAEINKNGKNQCKTVLNTQNIQKFQSYSTEFSGFESLLQKAFIESFRYAVILKIFKLKSLKTKLLHFCLQSLNSFQKDPK